MKFRLFILSFYPLITFSQEPQLSRMIDSATIVNAKPVKRVPPKYPVSAARAGQEGWVKLSFVIDKQGNVIEPIIEDSSGIKGFEKQAVRALKNWKYEPAQQDGKAIEQCKSTVQLDFRLQGNGGVTATFYRHYKKISTAITEKNYQLAEQGLKDLKAKKLWNMHENDWFWLADSIYAQAMNDTERELASVSRATYGGERTLGRDNYQYILKRKFILQMQHQLYANALDTFQKIRKAKGAEELIKKYEPVESQIIAAMDSGKPIIRNTHIGKRGHVSHKLSRNRFQLSEVQGPLKELEIRCDNHRSRFTAAEDSVWSIPASWGKCTVFFKGQENTKFDIVELANQA